MKKVLMTLLLAVFSVAVFAEDTPETKNFSILAESNTKTVNSVTYAEYKPYKYLNFTVLNTNTAGPEAYQGYFTTEKNVTFKIWQDIDLDDEYASNYDAFSGIESKYIITGKDLDITDYGIYYVDAAGNRTSGYISLGSSNPISSKVTVGAGENFGVYYKEGNVEGEGYITTTDNWVALDYIYDDNDHFATYADYDPTQYNLLTTEADHNIMTSKPFFCLFQGTATGLEKLEREHWEAGFLTDKPINGSPLPGTWTTLAICGLCAAAFRKRKNAKR